jgi:hypothetical protein
VGDSPTVDSRSGQASRKSRFEPDRSGRSAQAGHHVASNVVAPMNEVTRILSAVEQGDPQAAEQLLPLVYDELRKLAQEVPGQTLQPTALMHEADLRLIDVEQAQHWDSRGHFFAAAAAARGSYCGAVWAANAFDTKRISAQWIRPVRSGQCDGDRAFSV